MTDHGVPSTADDKYDSITCEWYSTVAVRSISISATSSVTPPSLLALCGWVVGTHTGCRPCQQLFYVFMCLEFRPHTLDLNPDVFIPGTTLVFQSRSSFHTPPCLLYPRCLNWDIPWLYSPWNLNKGCVHTDRTNLPWFNQKTTSFGNNYSGEKPPNTNTFRRWTHRLDSSWSQSALLWPHSTCPS